MQEEHEVVSIKRQEEQWKEIAEFPGYEISSFGRARSTDRFVKAGRSRRWWKGQLLSPGKIKGGYLIIAPRKNGKQYSRYIHRLVAEAFLPPPKEGQEVNHKDGDKTNNHVNNLQWLTHQENMQHSIDTGLRKRFVFKNHRGSGCTKTWRR